ncbi:hypothetical protein PORY_002664 [Pneumocystis oryctolagi]|uniref:Uncharacterized protein n=1 Tax=Pneumocystis oryctolagi TaxID=42067 RepID=A0ACB7C904_9ASCO|nr:hypothetical protein PORY_002664 [Pneumocystis oryctolagi]
MTQIKDPRREDLIKQFTPINVEEDIGKVLLSINIYLIRSTTDYTNFIVYMLGFSSIIFKNKWAAWGSFIATLSGILDGKTSLMSHENVMNFVISSLGLLTIYIPIIFVQKLSPEQK